jgi:hypothetical protein
MQHEAVIGSRRRRGEGEGRGRGRGGEGRGGEGRGGVLLLAIHITAAELRLDSITAKMPT